MKRNWPTITCSILVLIGSAIGNTWPEQTKMGRFLQDIGTGAGLLLAQSIYRKPKTPNPPAS